MGLHLTNDEGERHDISVSNSSWGDDKVSRDAPQLFGYKNGCSHDDGQEILAVAGLDDVSVCCPDDFKLLADPVDNLGAAGPVRRPARVVTHMGPGTWQIQGQVLWSVANLISCHLSPHLGRVPDVGPACVVTGQTEAEWY